jgi:hypothetical protein
MLLFAFLIGISLSSAESDIPFPFRLDEYRPLSTSEKNQARQDVLEMFYFGYDNYIKHAFPEDELDPIHCTGRGPDYDHPENININDVLGDYSLTLVSI